ncbi:MAG TPA: hypothetical protein VFU94_14540 [Conexibacter sp.]|nr:hypothetical protein [Conexibacter sp.]
MGGATIDQLTIADEPAAWAAVGFAVEGGVVRVGGIALRLVGRAAGRGIVEWMLRGAASEQLDGLATRRVGAESGCGGHLRDREQAAAGAESAPPPHPNGVAALDHVVAVTPALDRTVAALQAAGLDLRRIREEPTPAGAPRQAFFRLGEAILEVVQAPEEAIERSGGPDGPAFFWGLAFTVADLDATVAAIGEERCSPPRPAVQPGRRIATLRRAAGLGVPVALMTE